MLRVLLVLRMLLVLWVLLVLVLLVLLRLLLLLVRGQGADGRVLRVGSVHAQGWLGVEGAPMLVLLADRRLRVVDGRVGPLHVRRRHLRSLL